MQVIIDADACPRAVLGVIRRLQPVYGYVILSISSFNHRHDSPDHLTVGDEPQAADLAAANRAAAGDIVVTQDWGLAALALAKGARAISPDGRVFRPETIGILLEERALKARFRRGGGRTRGPAARRPEDDRRFEAEFVELLTGNGADKT